MTPPSRPPSQFDCAEWHRQHSTQTIFARMARDADGNLILRNIIPERPMQPIPNAQPARPVRIQVRIIGIVMNSMQTRSHKNPGKPALDNRRQSQIGMMEKDEANRNVCQIE